MKYRKKSDTIEAVQWNKDGDHPYVAVNALAPHLGLLRAKDDLMGGWAVYPGDYILTHSTGELTVIPKMDFELMYEPEGT